MENMLSPADVAVLSGRTGNNNGAFGDSGSWFIILFLIFAIFGWGGNRGNGWGGNGGGTSVYEGYVLNNDFSQLSRQLSDATAMTERKLDGVNNGLCDGFYAQNTTLLNGFSGVNQNLFNNTAAIQNTLTQGFSGLNTGMVQQGYENRIAVGNIGTQLSDCCCDIKGILKDNRYENSQNINALNNSMNAGFVSVNQANCLNTRDIIDNQNNGTRAILDAITANRLEDKNAQIQAQQNEINSLRLAASQSAQNEYLLNSLRNGCPVNAQLVCGNQPIPVQYITAGCGCNNGCNCGM